MRRTFLVALVAVAWALACPATLHAQDSGPAFGREVAGSIKMAQDFLLGLQDDRPKAKTFGSWEHISYPNGHAKNPSVTALVVYALLESGISPQDERMVRALVYMSKFKTTSTYALGLRANAWHVANRKTADKYLKGLKNDAGALAKTMRAGAYTYDAGGGGWDNSNSQYGVLGMWAAAQNGLDIRSGYWRAVMAHWKKSQNSDGGWGYATGAGGGAFGWYGRGTQPTMAVGGLATMFICIDNLPPSQGVLNCTSSQPDPVIVKAMEWMDNYLVGQITGPNQPTHAHWFYYMYGLERAALASGRKFFGGQDWYKIGARALMDQQIKDNQPYTVEGKQFNLRGAWNGPFYGYGWSGNFTTNLQNGNPKGALGAIQVDTALALLFLLRGNQPVLFNKLKFAGNWDNRPRELAAVTRWVSRTFEENVNWQIIPFETDVSEWRDAPMLYISGHHALNLADAATIDGFNDTNIEKLRRYVYQGGTIVSVTEADGPFKGSVRELYKKLFPDYELTECPPDHDIYKIRKLSAQEKVKFFILSNGIRPLVIHSDVDLARSWVSAKATPEKEKWAFEAAANISQYVIEDMGTLPARGTNTWLSAPELAGADEKLSKPPTNGSSGADTGPVDWLYLLIDGQIELCPPNAAGMEATIRGKAVKVPHVTDPGRVTVVSPSGVRINIPRELLGARLPVPDSAEVFLAEESKKALPSSVPRKSTVAAAGGSASIVRLKYNGNYDPEPLAYDRFTHLMETYAGTRVSVDGPLAIAELPSNDSKLAILTGTGAIELSAEERAALKTYLQAGGTLFIDAGGGSATFHNSLKKLLREIYPDNPLKSLAMSSPIYNISGATVAKARYRRKTLIRLGSSLPNLQAVIVDNRPVIIYSREDVTGGLVGYSSAAVDGYAPVSAFQILRNVVLFAGR